MKTIITSLVILWLISQALTIGVRWETIVHPAKNVVVTLESGQQLTGDLTGDWHGRSILVDASGTRHFVDNNLGMTIPAEVGERPVPWRLFGPGFIVFALALMYLISDFAALWRRIQLTNNSEQKETKE